MTEIISRQEALARGLDYFFTGVPCKYGHIGKRYVRSGAACVECHRQYRFGPRPNVRYQSLAGSQFGRYIVLDQWRYRYPPPRTNRAKEWLCRCQCGTEDWVRSDSLLSGRTISCGCYQKKTPELKRETRRIRRARPDVNIKENARSRSWKKRHPGRVIACVRSREEATRRATPPWADLRLIADLYESCPPGHHIDHLVPIGGLVRCARTADGALICGLHVPDNLQPMPGTANLRKGSRMTKKEQEFCEQVIITGSRTRQ